MKHLLLLAAALMVSSPSLAEVPYKKTWHYEQVDYSALNPIKDFKLPDSGQFRESTWVLGEDRDHPRNPMSFELVADGKIVFDNNTKLMWEQDINFRSKKLVPPKGDWMPQDVFYPKEIEPRRRPYQEAVQYCKSLELGGYKDWRLPTNKEAHTIAHYAAARPTIHEKYFSGVYPGLAGYGDRGKGGMWSGPVSPNHPNSAWHLGFIDGHMMGYPRGGYKTTRCVRADNNGAYFTAEFVDNGDGTVTENIAKLMWIKSVSPQKHEWEEAIQLCEDLKFAGFDDWKLPSNKEMTSMTDYTQLKPALDTSVFPDTDYKSHYWTRTNETRDAGRNLMSEITIQPEDTEDEINNANENAFVHSYMVGGSWRAPRRGFRALARCVRWVK
ncbi:MAG: DUF1566 domain-containing protein [Roseibium sp.]